MAKPLPKDERKPRADSVAFERLKAQDRALTTARLRNIEARNLIRVLQQYATQDDLRERIRAWLDGDPSPDAVEVVHVARSRAQSRAADIKLDRGPCMGCGHALADGTIDTFCAECREDQRAIDAVARARAALR